MTHELLFDLFLAIATVESACNPNVLGDNGKAVGIVQIHPGVVQDVNRIKKLDIKLEQRYSVKMSWYLFRTYTEHYASGGDAEYVARTWNGGPSGIFNPKTEAYWAKVKAILDNPYAMIAARGIVQRELSKEISK